MEGIHDIFPPDDDDANDPISEKKLIKRDGQYDVLKTLLGFEFDGVGKTLWLEEPKREKILTTLHSWIQMASRGHGGILFKQFEITSKTPTCLHGNPSRCGLTVSVQPHPG